MSVDVRSPDIGLIRWDAIVRGWMGWDGMG
jgi:hypothetical protein